MQLLLLIAVSDGSDSICTLLQAQHYVARSAFKLLEMQQKHKIIRCEEAGHASRQATGQCLIAYGAAGQEPMCWTSGAAQAPGCRWHARAWVPMQEVAMYLALTRE